MDSYPGLNFFTLYIKEAHPREETIEVGIELFEYNQAISLKDRRNMSEFFRFDTELQTIVYLDNMDNTVSEFFGAWPARIVFLEVKESEIKVKWCSGLGPYGYSTKDLETYIIQSSL